MRRILAIAAASLCLAMIGAGIGATVVLQAGWYDASAVRPHFQFVHTLIERGMQQSVRFHAREIAEPVLPPQATLRGGALFRAHCEQCHGGPGVAPATIGLSMQPVPGPLVDAARRWKPREIYWITERGIKMSGMPAWGFHLKEQEMWEIVAFLRTLPGMRPEEYAAIAPAPGQVLRGAAGDTREAAGSGAAGAARLGIRPGDAGRGKVALTQYGCQSCHHIPGVTGPLTYVGPELAGLARRGLIAGKVPAGEEGLAHWIMAPQQLKPGTAMPHLGVTERDARDMAAYLLRDY